MAEYDNEKSGVAFYNDYKKTDKQPTYRGTLQINGIKYKQAVWEKVAKSGKKYLSFSYELEADDANARNQKPVEAKSLADEIDDEIPF